MGDHIYGCPIIKRWKVSVFDQESKTRTERLETVATEELEALCCVPPRYRDIRYRIVVQFNGYSFDTVAVFPGEQKRTREFYE